MQLNYLAIQVNRLLLCRNICVQCLYEIYKLNAPESMYLSVHMNVSSPAKFGVEGYQITLVCISTEHPYSACN
jgi:hypothetical protein